MQVFAIELHGHVLAHAGEQFVEAQLHGLREREVESRQLAQLLLHLLDELLLGLGRGPSAAVFLQDDEAVGIVEAHRVGGDVGHADAGADRLHLGEVVEQQPFHLLLALDGLRESAARSQEGLHGDVALVEAGDKLAAHPGEGHPRASQQHGSGDEDGGSVAHGPHQPRMVAGHEGGHQSLAHALHGALQPGQQALWTGGGTHDHRRHHRYIGETEDEGSEHGKREGIGHGGKHLAADAREEDDGGEDNEDDELSEEGRVHHRGGRPIADVVHGPGRERSRGGGEPTACLGHDALDDDDGSVDDDAEVDGTQAHEVGPHAEDPHEDEGEEQRQRDDRCRDEPAPHAAQQQHEHEHHDEGALGKVGGDGRGGALDELRAVEEGPYLDAWGQRLLDGGDAVFHGRHHLGRVGSLEHHDRAAHGLAAVLGEGTVAHLCPEAHIVGHVAHEHGHAALLLHHDVADVVETLHQSLATDEVGRMVLLDIGPAGVHIVLVQGLHHLADGGPQGKEALGVERHLILLDAPAEGVDLHHAGNHRQLSLHYPVLDGAQLLRRVARGVARHEGVLIDLAQSGGDGAYLRTAEAIGNLVLHLLYLLVYQLPGLVGAHALAKDDGDHRQAEARHRPDVFHAGQVGHSQFDGVSDILFDIGRREVLGHGDDLHLVVGDIGRGVDVDGAQRIESAADNEHQQQEYDKLMLYGKTNDAVYHDFS